MFYLDIEKRLDDFHLQVAFEAGDGVVVILGASGAGKSLTLQSIAGLMTPDAGLIELGDRRLFDRAGGINIPPQRRNIGYVFQNYALFPHLTVAGNIAYGLHDLSRAARRERVDEMLALVRLESFASRKPGQLSGGQQQRVALARALATQPDLLLMDEPFAALDGPARTALRREFLALRRQFGIPVLFVTHDLEEAIVLADQLVVLADGEVRQSGLPRDVLNHPVDRDVAELAQARNILPGTLTRRDDQTVVSTAIGHFPVTVAPRTPEQVEVVIRPEAIALERCRSAASDGSERITIDGKIEEIYDHGTRMLARVGISGSALEVAISPADAYREPYQVGECVNVLILPADLHLIPAASG